NSKSEISDWNRGVIVCIRRGAAALAFWGLLSVCVSAHGGQPQTASAHPDLTGMWNGGPARGLAINPADPFGAYLAARDGTLTNFERNNTIIRRMDPNKPLYKPEFWEKVKQLDQNGNTEDPSYGCMPAGVPRMGPPPKIVQTATELLFFYVSPPAQA